MHTSSSCSQGETRNVGGLRDTMLLTVKAAELMQMLLQIDVEWLSVWNIVQFLRGKWKVW